MNSGARVRSFFLLCLCALLSACATRPDLVRLYENSANNPDQPPIIMIHGLAGSTLVDAKTGKQFWPGSLGTLAFSDYSDLSSVSEENREGQGLVPGELTYGVAGVDFYADLLSSLKTVGRFHQGVLGERAQHGDRHYYVLLYDWRKDNVLAVRKLHEMIEQIRLDYRDPNLKVDIIAHSNGGSIANYYYRYGPTDVLEQPEFKPWSEGAQRIRRLVMLGTPSLGAVTSLERLVYGTRMALRTVPVEVMVTFATPFQALPHPLVKSVLDTLGNPLDLNIYDPAVWREKKWSVYSPEVMARVRDSMSTPAEGQKALTQLQAIFVRNLHRAERLQWALVAPLPKGRIEVANFGGDCEPTPGRAVLIEDEGGQRLVFRPGQVHGPLQPGERAEKADKLKFERLMLEPGDGLITRESEVGHLPAGTADQAVLEQVHLLPTTQTFFLCESHGRLTHNLYFQNNLLYFLLSR
jgi:pimeloyl-ACP methyl ester carboxylesterase